MFSSFSFLCTHCYAKRGSSRALNSLRKALNRAIEARSHVPGYPCSHLLSKQLKTSPLLFKKLCNRWKLVFHQNPQAIFSPHHPSQKKIYKKVVIYLNNNLITYVTSYIATHAPIWTQTILICVKALSQQRQRVGPAPSQSHTPPSHPYQMCNSV